MGLDNNNEAKMIISGLMICGYSQVEAEQILILYGIEGGFSRLDQEVIKIVQQRYSLSEEQSQQLLETKGLIRVLEDLQTQPPQANINTQESYQSAPNYETSNSTSKDTNETNNSVPSSGDTISKFEQNPSSLNKYVNAIQTISYNKILIGLLIISGILGVSFWFFAPRPVSKSEDNQLHSNAIVIRNMEPVRDAPDINGKVRQTLLINSPLRILDPDKKQLWYEVETRNGITGWISVDGWKPGSGNYSKQF